MIPGHRLHPLTRQKVRVKSHRGRFVGPALEPLPLIRGRVDVLVCRSVSAFVSLDPRVQAALLKALGGGFPSRVQHSSAGIGIRVLNVAERFPFLSSNASMRIGSGQLDDVSSSPSWPVSRTYSAARAARRSRSEKGRRAWARASGRLRRGPEEIASYRRCLPAPTLQDRKRVTEGSPESQNKP